jgi:hypothetical protein
MSASCWRVLGLVAVLGLGSAFHAVVYAASPSEDVVQERPVADPDNPGNAGGITEGPGFELGGGLQQAVDASTTDALVKPSAEANAPRSAPAEGAAPRDASTETTLDELGLGGALVGLGASACLFVVGLALYVRIREHRMKNRKGKHYEIVTPRRIGRESPAPATERVSHPSSGWADGAGDEAAPDDGHGPTGTQVFSRSASIRSIGSDEREASRPAAARGDPSTARTGPDLNAAVLRPSRTIFTDADTASHEPVVDVSLEYDEEAHDGSWSPNPPAEPTNEEHFRALLDQLTALGDPATHPVVQGSGGAAPHMTRLGLDGLRSCLERYSSLLRGVSVDLSDETYAAEAEFLGSQVQWVSYFGDLLTNLLDEGQCIYTDPFGDEITFTSVEEWMDAVAVNLLDPLAERLSELERDQLRVGERRYALVEIYSVLLTQSLNGILGWLGFSVTHSFPSLSSRDARLTPEAGTMKVVGQEPLEGFEGCVVGTRVVGLMRERRVYRIAEVVTG